MAFKSPRLSMLMRTQRALATLLVAVLVVAVLAQPLCAAAKQQPSGLPRAQKHEIRHEIDQLEEEWRQAMLKTNTAEMAGLLADDYLAITPSGTLQTKDDTLANLRDGRTHFTSLEITERKVRFYGATALVTSVAEVVGTTSDGILNGSYRYTRVYVRNAAGAWKIVSFEANRMREPGEHK